jgi:uncharacterized protein YkwD
VSGGHPSPVRLLAVLMIAVLAPLGAMVATGLTGGTDDDQVETASGGGRGDRGGDEGGSALRADRDRVRDRAGTSTSSTAPTTTTTTAPPTTETTAPPTTPAPTAPPTSAPPATAPPATDPPAPAPAPTEAGQVVNLVNAARADAGCGALTADARLAAAAQGHSDDMAAQGYFSHTSLDGRSFADRVRAAGYPNPGGENIAQGQRSAQAVHDAWMNSQGHRDNILNCGFTTIGVGLHAGSWTWTQNFGY